MKRALPPLHADLRAALDKADLRRIHFDISPQALERWNPDIAASTTQLPEEEASISILDQIGFDPWTGEGVSVKRIAAALRSIGAEKNVTVNINSPGGDLFEGTAIYSLLREHKGNVTVHVLGVAASAASIVAMAGDTVQIAKAGFLMMHDTWVAAMGNRNDLRAIADMLEPFDAAMAAIYAGRSGLPEKDVRKMMDAETWISGASAIEQGFADDFLPADQITTNASAGGELRIAASVIDVALARAGKSRTERRDLMQKYRAGTPSAADDQSGTPSAAGTGTPSAAGGGMPSAAEREYIEFLNSFGVHI